MKICYCDESGTGDEPIAVMVGVIVDAQRMHVTKSDWKDLLDSLSCIAGKPIDEIHTREFYAGNDKWRSLPGEQRAEIITATFNWLSARKHDVVYVGVEKARFYESQKAGQLPAGVDTLWRFMGLHLLLCVQKAHQVLKKTKGHTIFVFDNEDHERMRFTDLIANPPAWTDSYYAKRRKQARLGPSCRRTLFCGFEGRPHASSCRFYRILSSPTCGNQRRPFQGEIRTRSREDRWVVGVPESM